MDSHFIAQRFAYALEMHHAGQLQQAEIAYREVLSANPHHVDALNNMAILAHDCGKIGHAETLLRMVIQIQPNHDGALNNLSNILRLTHRYEESLATSIKSIQRNPHSASAFYNYGLTLQIRHRNGEAIDAFHEAIRLQPSFFEAHSALAATLFESGMKEESIPFYKNALSLRPDYTTALNNYGAALMHLCQWDEAIGMFDEAIRIDPAEYCAMGNLANIQKDLFRISDAIENYKKSLSFSQKDPDNHSNYLLAQNYDTTITAAEHLHAAQEWQRFHAEPLHHLLTPHPSPRDPQKRLRLGFLSADLRNHSVAYFLKPLIDHIDREKFENYFYSEVRSPDEYTQHFEGKADAWRHTAGHTNEELAALIRLDHIDILFDLSGHTAYNRLMVFARKPAPLQISWLGYPNTTGLHTIDYRLTDEIADPPGKTDPYYTEKLVRIPTCAWCYCPPANTPEIAPLPAQSNSFITFGSFNAIAKMNEEMMVVWAKIMLQTPNSRLYLKNKSLGYVPLQQKIRAIFERHGIAADRIEMSPQQSDKMVHFASYGKVDISLDTFPYHGTTTTCEALWMGVPVVTLCGEVHASRVSVSLLQQLGKTEWVAKDTEEYIAIACELAADVERLGEERKNLRSVMRASPLMNEVDFSQRMQSKLRELWQLEQP